MVPKLFVFSKQYWFLHYHRLPCELEKAVLRTRENSDFFNSIDDIFGIHLKKANILYVLLIHVNVIYIITKIISILTIC